MFERTFLYDRHQVVPLLLGVPLDQLAAVGGTEVDGVGEADVMGAEGIGPGQKKVQIDTPSMRSVPLSC